MSKAVLMSIQPKWVELIANGKKTIEIRKTKPKLQLPFKVYIYCTRNNRKHAFHTYINSGYGRENFGVIGNWRSGKDIVDVNSHLPAYRYNAYLAEGKVIGEFVCDCMYGISNFLPYDDEPHHSVLPCVLEETCLEDYEIDEYLGAKDGYGWHISNLVIYDRPRELSEFKTSCRDAYCSEGLWFCKDGYGSCAIANKELEFPYNEQCIYFDCPSCGGESYEYEDFAYCRCDGLKPLTRQPQSYMYVEELDNDYIN